MAFITENSNVVSFAEYQDVLDRDQRLFDSNEGLYDDTVEPLLYRATERILSKMRSSSWWQNYYLQRGNASITSAADIPALDPNKIKSRYSDFTDLCVYVALSEYVLPLVADFGTQDNAEYNKMGYYSQRAETLFNELITAGDWYDFDGSGTISANEKQPGIVNLKRVR